MRVLLLNPPAPEVKYNRDGRCQSEANAWLDTFPPATFASIGGSVREKHDLKLIDCIGASITTSECLKEARDFNPDYTILSTSTPTIDFDLQIAKSIKEQTNTKIIIYGEYVTVFSDEILKKNPHVDFIIRSEPETPIMSILDGNYKVAGVSMRGWNGGLWNEPDLDKLPYPAYDLMPGYRFPLTGEKWMFVRSGRGCPYTCIYCVMPRLGGGKPRYHSPEYMIKQLRWLANDLDIKLWMFWDEIATYDRERMLKICEGIMAAGLHSKCKWFCTTRVDRFDEKLASKMYEAGCRMVSFGIESGSQDILDRNKKGIRLEHSRNAVSAARKAGMRTIGHMIIGLPGENDDTVRETIEFSKRLKLSFAQFYAATPFPASEFYVMALKNKWFQGDWDKVQQGDVSISYPNFSKERMEYWRRKAYREFYLRPFAICEGFKMMSFRGMTRMPGYLVNFLSWMGK